MDTPGKALATSIDTARQAFLTFSADLSPADHLYRPCPEANCAAWIIGHLIVTGRSMLIGTAGPGDLPALPDGFERRFGQKEDAPAARDFGDVTILRPMFDEHYACLAAAAEASPPDRLAVPLPKPHPLFGTVGQLFAFAPIHVSMHAGQISTIRRSLGRPALF